MKVAELFIVLDTKLDRFNKGMSDAERSMVRVGKRFTAIGKKMTMMVTLPLLAIAAAAVKMGADFEQSMMNAASVSSATGEELKRMEAIARDMGETTVFSARQAADAMYFMASAGWKVGDMGIAIKPILDLAAATQSDLAFATDTVVASLNQFQLGSQGAERVTNVFAAAIGNSQATMEKLSISMRYVGPLFNSMGKEVEEAAATLMVLYNAGYDASMAGTALRMGMVKLMDGTKKTTDALARLNLTLKDVDPTTMHFADIIGILGERGAKTKDVIDIFGVRAGPAFAALITQGGEAIRKFEQEITGTNAAAEMAEMQINTLKGSFKLLTSALTEAAIQIFKLLGPGIKDLVDNKLKPAVLWFNSLSESTKKTILVVGGLAAAAGPLLLVLGKILIILPKIKLAMALLTGPIGLVVAGLAILGKGIADTITSFKNLNKNWTAVEKELGRTPIWLEFARQAQIAGVMTGEFIAKLIRNKNDVIKTMDALAAGEIKNSENLRALYLLMLKKKEELLQKDKELAENLHKIEQWAIADIEAHKTALRAKGVAYYALRGDVEGYMKVMEDKIRIEEMDAEVITERIAKLKETTTAESLLYDALNEMNEALRKSENLTRKEIEQIELAKEALERKIEALIDTEEAQKTLIKAIEFSLTPEMKLARAYADGSITLLEYTSKMRELREERARMADDLADLELAEGEVTLILEEQGNVLLEVCRNLGLLPPAYDEAAGAGKKAADDIDTSWTNLNEKIEAEWISAFSNILRDFDNFSDTMDSLVDAIGKMFADTIAAIVVDWILGTEKMAAATAAMTSPIGLAVAGIVGFFKLIFELFIKMEESAYDAAEAWEEARRRFEEFTEAMGANLRTFDDYYQSLERVLQVFELTGEQIATIWDRDVSDVMRDFINLLKKTGREGDKAFIQLILRMREAGLEIRSLTEYIQDQLDRIPDALEGLLAPAVAAGDALEALKEKLAEQNEELAKLEEGTDEYIKLKKAIAATQEEIDAATKTFMEFGNDVERAGILALATFNAMIASGISWTEAISKMKDPLIALRDQYDALGLDANAALDKLFDIIGVSEAHKELFEAIDANRTILEALGNTGWLTQDALQALAGDAASFYDQLIAAGLSSEDALRIMAPTLQKLRDYAEAYGLKIDDATQALIDNAIELGVVSEEAKKPAMSLEDTFAGFQKMFTDEFIPALKGAFKGMGDEFIKIIGGEGGVADIIKQAIIDGFAEAFGQAETDAETAAENIEDEIGAITPVVDIGFDYDVPDFDFGGRVWLDIDYDMPEFGGKSFQHEGIAWRPAFARVAEKGPEVIANIQKLQAGTSRFSGMFAIPPQGAEKPAMVINPTVNIYAQTLDDFTIRKASEKLFAAIEYEKNRRGYE